MFKNENKTVAIRFVNNYVTKWINDQFCLTELFKLSFFTGG